MKNKQTSEYTCAYREDVTCKKINKKDVNINILKTVLKV